MTAENRETLQRALGILEGASYGASERVQNAIYGAVEMIDIVLDKEEREYISFVRRERGEMDEPT